MNIGLFLNKLHSTQNMCMCNSFRLDDGLRETDRSILHTYMAISLCFFFASNNSNELNRMDKCAWNPPLNSRKCNSQLDIECDLNRKFAEIGLNGLNDLIL